MLNSVIRVDLPGKEVLLIGTAHVSKESVELVRETIENESPDMVAVELCAQRHHAISEKKKWDETDVSKVIKEGKGYLFLTQLMLTNFQRKVGDELGVKPGSEMVKALEMAKEKNIPIALVDRDISVTLKRALNRMGFREKINIFFGLVSGIFEEEKVTEEMVEKLKEMDVLTEMMEELGREIPSVKETLLDERNIYIADKIASLDAKKIVAVVGAGHVSGIKEILESKLSGKDIGKEIAELETVPEKKGNLTKYINFAFPVIVILLVVLGFFMGPKDPNFLMDSAVKWIFLTGGLAAIGAALALAHPLSIVTAFIVAPLTTLHPALAAGWFSGWVEAKLRPPKVKDFDGLYKINSIRDLWNNRVTKIILVIGFTNLGASSGAIIGVLSFLLNLLSKINFKI
ncbi:MAG: TraB/GumN family protein [Candidatus Altiarchaeia archaeon]